jgi:hypothetical protein
MWPPSRARHNAPHPARRHLLDLESWAWRKAVCEGQSPAPREGAAADYHAGHMVLFGEAQGGAPPLLTSPARAWIRTSRRRAGPTT